MVSLQAHSGLPLAVKGSSLDIPDQFTVGARVDTKIEDMRFVLAAPPVTEPGVIGAFFEDVRHRSDADASVHHDVFVLSASMLGKEFNKTVGSIQGYASVFQVYHGMCGFLLQSGSSYRLVIAGPQEKVLVPARTSVFLHNFGRTSLVVGRLANRDLKSRSSLLAQRQLVLLRRGARYYFLREDGHLVLRSNPHYHDDFSQIHCEDFDALFDFKFELHKKGLEIFRAAELSLRDAGLRKSDFIYKKKADSRLLRFLSTLPLESDPAQ